MHVEIFLENASWNTLNRIAKGSREHISVRNRNGKGNLIEQLNHYSSKYEINQGVV